MSEHLLPLVRQGGVWSASPSERWTSTLLHRVTIILGRGLERVKARAVNKVNNWPLNLRDQEFVTGVIHEIAKPTKAPAFVEMAE